MGLVGLAKAGSFYLFTGLIIRPIEEIDFLAATAPGSARHGPDTHT